MCWKKSLLMCGVALTIPLAAASHADARHGHHRHHHGVAPCGAMAAPVVHRRVYRVTRVVRPVATSVAVAPVYTAPYYGYAGPRYGAARVPYGGVYGSGYRGTGVGVAVGTPWGSGPRLGVGTGFGVGVSPFTGRGYGFGPTIGFGPIGMW